MDAVFARLVAAAAPLVPHAEAVLATLAPDGSVLRAISSTEGELFVPDSFGRWLLEGLPTPGFGSGVPELDRRSWVKSPLILDDAPVGVLVFFAQASSVYGQADLAHAETIARVIVAMARTGVLGDVFGQDNAERDLILDPSEEVLRELADVLDVRSIFPRISAIVGRVLAHDRLTMTFHDADGSVRMQVASDTKPPEFMTVKVAPEVLARPFVLLPDLSPEGLATYEPPEARAVLLRSGYRSFLAVNLNARNQRMGVEFWSHRVNGFSLADVPLARHVATCLALAVSHEQLAEGFRGPEERVVRAQHFETRVGSLMAEIAERPKGHRRVAGQSRQWTSVLQAASRVAETEATVLLIGESGTGKELIARFIHEVSNRHHRPFIGVNCAALPEQLLESELFGFERGAFTGASHTKPGQIELAEGGVLFLDEVSEMSPSAQAKFLRVLQEREFRRLGGTRLIKTNTRIIAATNTDLQQAIKNGQFRRDLYYRLRVFDLKLPPLRERREDIPVLSETLLDEIALQLQRRRPRLTPAAHAALLNYHWPGNVRELRNVLERASIVCDHDALDASHLSFDTETLESGFSTDLSVMEREMIEKVLVECGGNKSAAAKRLGLSRMQLYVRLRRYQSGAVN
ncbi:MAG: sigma 54-interacting transcriptional regulator [Acidobacteriota bacterium]